MYFQRRIMKFNDDAITTYTYLYCKVDDGNRWIWGLLLYGHSSRMGY